jgi:hypothetical protein
VARAFGADPVAQMERDYAETLWSFMELREVERLDAFQREGEQLRGASFLAIAFHEPKKLKDAGADLERRMAVGAYAESVADVRAKALALIADEQRKAAALGSGGV